jgi:hypothetical protein
MKWFIGGIVLIGIGTGVYLGIRSAKRGARRRKEERILLPEHVTEKPSVEDFLNSFRD